MRRRPFQRSRPPISAIASSPTFRDGGVFLGVSAVSPDDVLAVGYVVGGRPLLDAWDGDRWNRSKGFDDLIYPAYAASADASTNGWAAGRSGGSGLWLGHWDGHTYTPVQAPSPGYDGAHTGVADRASDDAWAVGWALADSGGPLTTLIDHWDGTAWRHVPSPNPFPSDYLTGVSATAAADAWAVGRSSSSHHSFVLHWDGSSWSR